MAKGKFIEYVVSNNPNKYPNDGEQGGYYWELYGTPKTLISFTIEGTSYQAEEGMTWAEWVNSEYNTGGYITIVIDNNNVTTTAGLPLYGKEIIATSSSSSTDGSYIHINETPQISSNIIIEVAYFINRYWID